MLLALPMKPCRALRYLVSAGILTPNTKCGIQTIDQVLTKTQSCFRGRRESRGRGAGRGRMTTVMDIRRNNDIRSTFTSSLATNIRQTNLQLGE